MSAVRPLVICLLAIASIVSAAAIAAPPAAPDLLGSSALMNDVATYAGLAATHLSGTTDSGATERWVQSQLRAAGLETGSDAYSFLRFIPQRVRLTVDGVSAPSVVARFYSGTTPEGGLAAPLAYAGYGLAQSYSQGDAKGKIAVIDVPEADGAVAPTLDSAIANAKAAGAVGLVAVTEGPEDYPVQEDVDSRAGVLGIPTVFVGKRTGAGVIAAAKAGDAARLELDADVGTGCDNDVYGVLPGADPNRYVVIGTPISAFVPAASERGAGVAILLGLARHYAALPRSQRPETLVFVGTTGHEVGFLGLPVFMQAHPAWFAAADAYIHLGASLAASQIAEAPNGTIVRTPAGDPTRLLYTSENPLAQAIAQKAFAQAQIASAAPGVRNVGEQAYAYHAGLPIISASGASYYFHTAGDQADGVSQSLLAAMAAGFRESIDGVMALPAGAMRAANPAAAALGAQQSPNPTPSGSSGGGDHEPVLIDHCSAPPVAQQQDAEDPGSASNRPGGAGVGLGLVPTFEDPQPAFDWQGHWQSREFAFPSQRTGAMLYGNVFAPTDVAPGDQLPAVVIAPGSGPGIQSFYQWSARDLAGHGYLAVTIDPQGVGRSETFGRDGCDPSRLPDISAVCPGVPFQQADNYVDALQSGIDYVLSSQNPWRSAIDPDEIGIAGHSLAARAASYLQGVDPRVKAVVAWDNLASDLQGDAGSPSGGGTAGDLIGGELPGASEPVRPRVPALGEASDGRPTSQPTNTDPDVKKTAWSVWRKAGQPSMEVVFAGSSHLDWAQDTTTSSAAKTTQLERFEYYTRAWFDRWLLHDATATSRLLARTVDGADVKTLLSTKWRSAAFLDGHDCPDLSAGC